MKRRIWAVVVTVGFGATAAIAWQQWSARNQSAGVSAAVEKGAKGRPQPVDSALRCAFAVGDRLAFSVDTTTKYSVAANPFEPGDEKPSWSTQLFRAKMYWRVIEDGAGPTGEKRWSIAGVFTSPTMTVSDKLVAPELIAGLTKPVLFRIDENCLFSEFAPTDAAPIAARNQWQMLLKMLEFGLVKDAVGEWDLTQRDTTAEYHAHYRRAGAADGIRLMRSREPFGELGSDEHPISSEIVASASEALVEPRGRWFKLITLNEHARLYTQHKVLSEVVLKGELRARTPDDIGEFWVRNFRTEEHDWSPAEETTRPERPMPYSDYPPIAGLESRSMTSVMAEFAAFIRSKPQAKYDEGLNLLVQYLRLKPELARSLVADMKADRLDPELRAMTFLALQQTGGETVHKVLAEASRDTQLSRINRLQAVTALKEVPDVNRQVIDDLKQIHTAQARTPEDRDVRNTAMLGIGAIGRRPNLPPEDKAVIVNTLAEAVRSRDKQDVRIGLSAIGNTGDPAMGKYVEPFLKSDDPDLRAGAIQALSSNGALPPATQLVDVLLTEKNSDVLRAYSDAIVEGDPPVGPGDVTRIASTLRTKPPVHVREPVIQLLGELAKTNAEAHSALIEGAKVEDVPRVMVLYGKYLKVSELP